MSKPRLLLRVTRQAGPSDTVAVHSLVELVADGVVLWRCHGIESAKHLMAAGTYIARWTMSPRFKRRLWEITGVLDGTRKRAGLRIHAVNYARDLQGCLALGKNRIDIDKDGTIDIARSAEAMGLFHDATFGHTEMDVQLINP